MKRWTEYEIYVPSKGSRSSAIKQVKEMLIKNFGGVTETLYPNKGVWRYGTVEITESVSVWRFLGKNRIAEQKAIRNAQHLIKTHLKQKAVMVVRRKVDVL